MKEVIDSEELRRHLGIPAAHMNDEEAILDCHDGGKLLVQARHNSLRIIRYEPGEFPED